MTHEAPAIFVALEQSGFATAIRQSPWLYPAANVGHIVSLVFFVGAVAVMDVRLLGGLAMTAPGPLLSRARGFAVAALVGMAVTGFVLFSAEASHLDPRIKAVGDDAFLVLSEPLVDLPGAWEEIPESTAVITKGPGFEQHPFNPALA